MKVSVLIQTYKHEAFIAQCIESAMMQKTSFPFEIIVGAEEGDNETISIAKQYESNQPIPLKVIVNSKDNVVKLYGSRVGRANFINMLSHAKGEYIARCDGDDYWTAPDKLQKQVNFLDENPDYTFCGHAVQRIDSDGNPLPFKWKVDVKEDRTIYDLIHQIQVPTGSVMYRNSAFKHPIPKWFYKPLSGDIPLFFILADKGKLKFWKNQYLSVYREHSGGITKSYNRQKNWLLKRIEMYAYIDAGLGFRYHNEFKKLIRKIILSRYSLILRTIYKKGMLSAFVEDSRFLFRYLRRGKNIIDKAYWVDAHKTELSVN